MPEVGAGRDPRTYDISVPDSRASGISAASGALRAGRTVLLPLDVQYGLLGDAFDAQAVDVLRSDKDRPTGWAPPLLVPRISALHGVAMVTPQAAALAEAFWPGQVSLLCEAQPSLRWGMGDTTAGIVVRMPLHPVALEVLDGVGPLAVVVPGGPRGREAATAAADLPSADVRLVGAPCREGRSTVVDVRGEVPVLRRRGTVSLSQLRSVVPQIEEDDRAVR